MSKTYHHGDLKREAISKTVEIIQQKGEVDFTLREVAESLKISHTAVYRHFRSKQDLLSHIAEEGFLNLCSQFEQVLKSLHNPKQKLESVGETYIAFALQYSGHYRAMFHSELHCNGDQRPELEAAGAQAFQVLSTVLSEGMKSRHFQKENAETLARSVWAALHGFSTLLIDGQFQSINTKTEMKAAIRRHLAFVLRAVELP